jgi:hypothetical protein
MPNTTVFLLDIIGSNSLHGPVRELHQDNGISNQINLYYLVLRMHCISESNWVVVTPPGDHLSLSRPCRMPRYFRILEKQLL